MSASRADWCVWNRVYFPSPGEQPKIALSVYTIAGGKVTLLKTIERITANTLAWSPRGRHLVVAGLGR